MNPLRDIAQILYTASCILFLVLALHGNYVSSLLGRPNSQLHKQPNRLLDDEVVRIYETTES
jgi:hypothetical protein